MERFSRKELMKNSMCIIFILLLTDMKCATVNREKCKTKTDCENGKKCCSGGSCKYYCQNIYETQNKNFSLEESLFKFKKMTQLNKKIERAIDPNCYMIPKFGKCPNILINRGKYTCFVNENCSGNRLCCPSAEGYYCSDPVTDIPGLCPTKLINPGTSNCFVDENCGIGRRCCKESDCSYRCSNVDVPSIATTVNPNCYMIPKYGTCPATLINPGQHTCFVHENCSGKRLCCNDGTGTKKCSDPATSRSGACPFPGSLLEKGEANCFVDENCGNGRKCCQETPCTFYCSDVLKPSTVSPTIDPSCYSIPKFGICPPNLVNAGKSVCFVDENCSGNRKCCPDGTGVNKCSDPLQTHPGKCPLPGQLVNIGINPCYVDDNCGNNRRCCGNTPCSYFCSDITSQPITTITPSPPCYSIPKYGTCPTVLIKEGSSVCFVNENCSGNRLCCKKSSGGSFCSDPQRNKLGECPEPGKLIRPGISNCYDDENCSPDRLCCQQTRCSFFCSDPIITTTTESPTTSTNQSTIMSSTETTVESSTEKTTETFTESTTGSTTELITESTIESTTEPTTQSTTESATESTTESTIKSTAESTMESTTESTIESTAESTTESITESTTEYTTESTNESTTESITESTAETTTEKTMGSTPSDSISTTESTIITPPITGVNPITVPTGPPPPSTINQ